MIARIAAVTAALALLAAACQPDVEPVRGEDLIEQAREAIEDLRPGEPDQQPAPDERKPEPDAPPAPGDDPAGDAGPPAAVEEQPPTAAVDDRAGLGGMCRAYVRGNVPRLVVEVAHHAGAAPTQEAVQHLLGVLRTVVDKPGGVSVELVEIPGGSQTWTRADLERVSREHRVHTSGPDQLVMHALSLRGGFEDPDTIGVAFDASSFAIFPDRIGGFARLLGGQAAIERAVLVHEAGHLLCLINITYTSELDHEDPEHPHHSRDTGSVMHSAVDSSAIAQVFSGPPPADFTANDRADLQRLRDGAY